jgi:xanthosine utilization system XapX-like protein
MQVLRHSTWKQLALFGLVGPPVGGAAILLWSHVAGQPPLPFRLGAWLFIAFPMAYLYAGVPALVTGYSAALARAIAPGSGLSARARRFAVPLLVGPVASVLFSLVTVASEADLSIAAVGALAAFVCTLLSEWLLRLRPNNSFKPKPLRGSA